MLLISKETINTIDYETEILDYIKKNSGGVSITEISNEKNFSRNTVAKYASLLEHKRLIFKKKIGPSKLLFSVESTNYPSSLVLSYYKSLLKGFKTMYPNDKERMKEIGILGANDINFTMPTGFLDNINSTHDDIFSKFYMELFKNLYTSFDVLQPDVKISIIESDVKNGSAIFRFANSIFLDGNDDYIFHLYFVCGIAQERMSNFLKIPVKVNVEKIHLDKEKEFSYYDLSIKTN